MENKWRTEWKIIGHSLATWRNHMAHNFGNIKFQKNPPSPLPPPAKRKQDGPLRCMLPHTIGWKDYYYYFGTQMDQFHCKKKDRKHATQPGPEGNPKPKSPKVTEVRFGDVRLGFPSMEPFCHCVVWTVHVVTLLELIMFRFWLLHNAG